MAKIHKLSPSLADMIAAGEVVERPASVIKELVENAIDAGASQITVEIRNGGVTFVRVTDDGCGMSAEDAPTAFLRHATSKIAAPEDLGHITTMGFRGEALAAISAVSRVDLMTKTAEAETGVSVRAEAGTVLDVTPAGCPQGTTIIVRDLFYNTPARMKFLKRDSVEGSYIAGAVQRQALAHPEVAFRFFRDGSRELSTPGDGKLLSAVYTVMGRQAAKDMIEIQGTSDNVTVRGYVGKPTSSRGNRGLQHFFVNGRYVKSPMMTSALEEAYRNRMMTGRFPVCVLHVEVPPTAVDVNVHPAKTEVKFLREKDVFDAIHYIVLGALNRTQDRPELNLPKQRETPKTDFYKTMTAEEYRTASTLSRPEQKTVKDFLSALPKKPSGSPGILRDGGIQIPGPAGPVSVAPAPVPAQEPEKKPVPAAETPVEEPEPQGSQMDLPLPPLEPPRAPEAAAVRIAEKKPEAPPYRIIGQTMATYILVEQGDTLLIFDKHAAHERILFEKLKAQGHEIMSQVLLDPLSPDLTAEEQAVLLDNSSLLSRLGFTLTGEHGLRVAAIPADLEAGEAEICLAGVAQALMEGAAPDPDGVFDELLHTMACKAAIKGGRYTAPDEIEALVAELMARDDIQHCPHGRPVCITLTRGNLEHQFKRS